MSRRYPVFLSLIVEVKVFSIQFNSVLHVNLVTVSTHTSSEYLTFVSDEELQTFLQLLPRTVAIRFSDHTASSPGALLNQQP